MDLASARRMGTHRDLIYERKLVEAIAATPHEEIEPTPALICAKHGLSPDMLGRMVIELGLLNARTLDAAATQWMEEAHEEDQEENPDR